MVSSAHPLASKAGVEMLESGGNAVDAAVAAAFAIGVAEPFTSGIGGGGFMLVRFAGGSPENSRTIFLDYREVAPAAAMPDMYQIEGDRSGDNAAPWTDKAGAPATANDAVFMGRSPQNVKTVWRANETGHKAIAVPGSIAGMAMALDLYGTKSLTEVVEPAARIAEEGIVVGPFLREAMRRNLDRLRAFSRTARIYLKDNDLYEVGDTLVNPDYARTLRLIGSEGPKAFYEGEVARAVVRDMQVHGGLISFGDLSSFRPALREPVRATYRGYEIISSPPPSSGGTCVAQILSMLEGFDIRGMGFGSARYLHLLAEAMKMSFADREAHMGDPGFVDVPLTGLLDKAYARDRIAGFDPARAQVYAAGNQREHRGSHQGGAADSDRSARLSSPVGPGAPGNPNDTKNRTIHEGSSTTHLSVMDNAGNAVSLTQTVEAFFGSAVVLAGYGFIMNNEMLDFDPVPGGPNSVAPGKKPLSSMSPTIVLKDGRPILSVGSPGSKRIITAVTQVLLNVLDHGMGIAEAIDAPRIHTDTGVLHIEGRFSPGVAAELEALGHNVNVHPEYDFYFGGAHGVLYDPGTGELRGGADPRREGAAIGV